MSFCLRSWLTGFALGLSGAPYPYSAPVPVAYLYNGIRLPALPEWDRGVYPYAVIVRDVLSFDDDVYSLFVTENAVTIRRVLGEGPVTDGSCLCYCIENSEFVRYSVMDNTLPFGSEVVWANHDVCRHPDDEEPNTLVLSASDPIPVYE